MASAVRILASFLLALSASVGPLVVAVLSPWLEEVAAFYITFVLTLFLPVMIASGLAWLPVMLAAGRRGFDGKLGAVTMSPLATVASYALYVTYQGLGHDLAKPTAWGAMILLAPMMIVFSAVFLYVDPRWEQSKDGTGNARMIIAAAVLVGAWVLALLMLLDDLRR
jgi:hypothetical protein